VHRSGWLEEYPALFKATLFIGILTFSQRKSNTGKLITGEWTRVKIYFFYPEIHINNYLFSVDVMSITRQSVQAAEKMVWLKTPNQVFFSRNRPVAPCRLNHP